MITSLYIQNLAVIEKMTIDLKSGMNIFTGETGAGKSIVVDAIGAILGGRCSKDLIRSGEEKAVMIGTFQNNSPEVFRLMEESGIELEDDELIIQREVNSDGKTAARVNGRPVTVSILREIGKHLINIHGQQDQMTLLVTDKHREILDSYGNLEKLVEEYQTYYERLQKTKKELEEIRADQAGKKEKLDLLQYEIEEIEEADLKPDEDSELENQSRAIRNAAKITESLQEAHQYLSGIDEQPGAYDQINLAISSLEYASAYYEDVAKATDRLKDISYDLEAVNQEVSTVLDHLDFDTERLNSIEGRLDEIFRLKQKYGRTVEDILQYLEESKEKYQRIEMYDARMNELIVEEKRLQAISEKLAQQLTEERGKAAQNFVNALADELEFLDMRGVQMRVQFTPCELTKTGKEKIEFLISTNPGEPPRPLAKIASGGELSRIMLSIKNTMADKDNVPTLIFDEVDSGVSGSAAQKIGLKIKQASQNCQVFCVTHLAQIAAMADHHFLIQKSTKEGRTFTEVNELSYQERIEEVARIISTGEITNAMLGTAKELVDAFLPKV